MTKNNRIRVLLAVAIFLAYSSSSQAQTTLSFDTVWSKIKNQSPELKQAQSELSAANQAHQRSKRFWLPQAKITSQVFTTNDPASTLFSNLGQRSVTAGDFNPATLNHPGYDVFSQSSLNVTMPIYIGGAGVSNARALEHLAKAKSTGMAWNEVFQFTTAASEYSFLLAATTNQNRIANLSKELQLLLDQYQLGSAQNPVGYSGLLGLKSLSNRLKGMRNNMSSEILALKSSLTQKMKFSEKNWRPAFESTTSFVSHSFGKAATKTNDSIDSLPAQSLKDTSAAYQEWAKAEKANLLPQIGAFGQQNLNIGERNSAFSTAAGLYLQWNLFSPTTYGSSREKKLQALALNEQAEGQNLSSKIALEQSQNNTVLIRENLKLLSNSLELLKEQTTTGKTLYQNGSINILQLAEILNRRADLLDQIYQAEKAFIMESARNYLQRSSKNGK